MNVTVTHGTSYMAIDPGPAKLRLQKGESALAAVSWSDTVEVDEDKAAGTYLSIAGGTRDEPVVRRSSPTSAPPPRSPSPPGA
jgi:hypothetical protein